MDSVFSLFGFEEKGEKKREADQGIAMSNFRQRLSVNRASMGPHYNTAPGFDYLHWKQFGQHRVRINHENDFALQCRRLQPYVQSISDSVWLGREETRWAGLSRPEAQQPLGSGVYGSRYGSQAASQELLSRSREYLSR